MKRKVLLWIDDYRNPFEDDWLNFSPIGRDCDVVWVKSYSEAISWLTSYWPDGICFDHDLGEGPSGYDIAKYVSDRIVYDRMAFPKIASQSANPVGRKNIIDLFKSVEKFINMEQLN